MKLREKRTIIEKVFGLSSEKDFFEKLTTLERSTQIDADVLGCAHADKITTTTMNSEHLNVFGYDETLAIVNAIVRKIRLGEEPSELHS